MRPAHAQFASRHGLSEEEIALLRHSNLEEAGGDDRQYDEFGEPVPPSFRERLVLGDISW